MTQIRKWNSTSRPSHFGQGPLWLKLGLSRHFPASSRSPILLIWCCQVLYKTHFIELTQNSYFSSPEKMPKSLGLGGGGGGGIQDILW